MRNFLLFCLCSAGVISTTPVRSETVKYYYLSGLSQVSNFSDVEKRLNYGKGVLEVDTSELSGGSLSGKSLEYSADMPGVNGIPANPAVKRASFSSVSRSPSGFDSRHYYPDYYKFSFGSSGEMTDWDAYQGFSRDDVSFFSVSGNNRMPASGSFYDAESVFHTGANRRANSVLTGLGYREGSSRYVNLYCGSWSGEVDGLCVNDYAEGAAFASTAWISDIVTKGSGRWFTDLLDYETALSDLERRASENPPVSYFDIPPASPAQVPLPAPFLMLGAAILLLKGLGARKAGAPIEAGAA